MNTLFFAAGADPAPDVKILYTALLPYLPTQVNIAYDGDGDTIDDSTGALTGSWTGTHSTAQVGTGGVTYSAPAGAVVNWKTSTIVNGRRLAGKSFWVPLEVSAYDGDGTLSSGFLSAMNSALGTYLASTAGSQMLVWHRPHAGNAGNSHAVTGASIPDLMAVLRSRRD